MEAEFISLFVITLMALICPILASLLPNKIIPETVFLLIAGMLIGPNVLDVVQIGDAVNLLSELGLGFLFLLAGYEIDVKELSGKGGKSGFATWIVTFVLALGTMIPFGIWRENISGGLAAAIILTTTAFGTLVPILKDRDLTDKPIGKAVVEYGVWGELGPVIAMALLLTTRATWITITLLLIFAGIAVISATVLSKSLQREGSKLANLIEANSETNAQMSVRVVVMLMVGLVTLSAIFNLDVVLGAFAAGFVLRVILPKGDAALEHKLNGLCYGFFIPLFFIVSGSKIDPEGVIEEPLLLVVFIISLLLIRAVPIFVSLNLRKDTKNMDVREKASVALYCTTALPLIVAVASVATSSGAFPQEVASVLIAAGGITVLLMPFFASIVLHTLDADIGGAAREIAANPRDTMHVLKKHRQLEREKNTTNKRVFSYKANKRNKEDSED